MPLVRFFPMIVLKDVLFSEKAFCKKGFQHFPWERLIVIDLQHAFGRYFISGQFTLM